MVNIRRGDFRWADIWSETRTGRSEARIPYVQHKRSPFPTVGPEPWFLDVDPRETLLSPIECARYDVVIGTPCFQEMRGQPDSMVEYVRVPRSFVTSASGPRQSVVYYV